jgi:hypothetical protein
MTKIQKQIEKMEAMKLPELQARFAEVVGEETKAPNKKYLIKKIVQVLEKKGEPEIKEPPPEETRSQAEADSQNEEQEQTPSLNKLDVETLRERYAEIVGRPTGSRDKRYLLWKIKQAQQGKIPVGPIPGRRGDGVERDYKVLPIRMEADLVEKLDEVWKRQGLKSRMELFRKSLASYMASVGEDDLAEMLVL